MVFEEDQKFVVYQQVKAIDVKGAKTLVEPKGAVLLNVLKGHPEVVA